MQYLITLHPGTHPIAQKCCLLFMCNEMASMEPPWIKCMCVHMFCNSYLPLEYAVPKKGKTMSSNFFSWECRIIFFVQLENPNLFVIHVYDISIALPCIMDYLSMLNAMYVCMFVCMYVCMYVCLCECIYLYMYVCMYVCMYVQYLQL